MNQRIRVLLLIGLAVACLPAWGFPDAPDPVPLLAKLPAPPKDFAAAKARCADPKSGKNNESDVTYIGDPQSQALEDEVAKDRKSFADAMSQQARANMAQAMAPVDPRQSVALAQAMQSLQNTKMPPNPVELSDQLLTPLYQNTEKALQDNEKQESDGARSWQTKYEACDKLPGFLAKGCQKPIMAKANSESDGYVKQRQAIMDKYYTDLNTAWSQYADGAHKFLDAQQFQVPQGTDPKFYQFQLLKATNQDERLNTVEQTAHGGVSAFCPGFMGEADRRYGGICEGEGC